MFDTLLYTKRLEAAGFQREQAEQQVKVMTEMIVDGVATKQDLRILEADVRADLRRLEDRITIKLGSIMVAGIGVLAILLK